MKKWRVSIMARMGEQAGLMEKDIEADFIDFAAGGVACFWKHGGDPPGGYAPILVYSVNGWTLIEQLQEKPKIEITQPVGLCDGSGIVRLPPTENSSNRSAFCPGCRACK